MGAGIWDIPETPNFKYFPVHWPYPIVISSIYLYSLIARHCKRQIVVIKSIEYEYGIFKYYTHFNGFTTICRLRRITSLFLLEG
jgi:hypothetical protein